MNPLATLVKAHARAYPLMRPCDAVKLLYQHEFGGGHLVTDAASSLRYLREEAATAGFDSAAPLLEDIGNGYQRLNLRAVDGRDLSWDLVNRIFCASSKAVRKATRSFAAKLELLRELAGETVFSFSISDLEAYLDSYLAAGCPAVSHSQQYRRAYRPAYRVVSASYTRLLPLVCGIDRLARQKTGAVAAIDGNAAAGKTTAAALLADLFDLNIVHMDDFFLPPALRTEARLREPGGNIHYERFESEVLLPLARGNPFSYRVFDCAAGRYRRKKYFMPKRLTLIEGAYSLHPRFRRYYALTAFLSVDAGRQRERILKRNGPRRLKTFLERWIPMEQRYFDDCAVPQSCDFVLRA